MLYLRVDPKVVSLEPAFSIFIISSNDATCFMTYVGIEAVGSTLALYK